MIPLRDKKTVRLSLPGCDIGMEIPHRAGCGVIDDPLEEDYSVVATRDLEEEDASLSFKVEVLGLDRGEWGGSEFLDDSLGILDTETFSFNIRPELKGDLLNLRMGHSQDHRQTRDTTI